MTTLASSIITDAYRESNIIPAGNSPTTTQQTEALGKLNTLILSTIGNEAGDGFDDYNIGGTTDQSNYLLNYIPANARVLLNLTGGKSYKLHPNPFEGQRLGIVDVIGNLATYPVTLDGNGRNIEGTPTLVLNVNSDNRQWMYRADIGQWVKITTLLYTDTIPFPQEFDDYFITMLAMRLNPRYGQSLAAESQETLKRSRSLLRDRYHAYRQIRPDLDTRSFQNYRWTTSNNEFNTGKADLWK
jgi:hypothetical protein